MVKAPRAMYETSLENLARIGSDGLFEVQSLLLVSLYWDFNAYFKKTNSFDSLFYLFRN